MLGRVRGLHKALSVCTELHDNRQAKVCSTSRHARLVDSLFGGGRLVCRGVRGWVGETGVVWLSVWSFNASVQL